MITEAPVVFSEAYRYAQDWFEVLSSAGWKNEQPIPVGMVLIGGQMWTGIRVSVFGTWDEATQHGSLLDGSAEKTAFECFNAAHIAGQFIPYKDVATGTIQMIVSEHP